MSSWTPGRRRSAVAAGTCLPLLAAALALPAAAQAAGNPDSEALRAAVSADNAFAHLRAFQAFADANGGTRVSGSPGYDASADYVQAQLEDAGYLVTRQPFTFPFFEENSPTVLRRLTPTTKDEEVQVFSFSGSGDVSGPVRTVTPNFSGDRASSDGCEPADFAAFDGSGPNDIALIQRGTCAFDDKATNAKAAGAEAVVIFNQGNGEGRTDIVQGTLGSPTTLPVVGVSFATGQELATAGTTARVFTDTTNETRSTSNVIAESRTGDGGNVVMQGAHLDSVAEGPGIQDNGTGSAGLLELALKAASLKPTNKLRFAWWGAEESGLLGAEHYVEELSDAQRSRISLYLNYDMIGSPNFARFVYDGDGSAGDAGGPAGSTQIEQGFLDYFASQGLAVEPTAFDGRSDYGPFIAVGIPAGGLFTGAEEIKTPEQATKFGGTAGVAFDPNYHQAGDTIDNVNRTVLDQNIDAMADALIRYGMSSDDVNNVGDLAYGLTAANEIISFRTETPDSVLSQKQVSLASGEDLVGIDVRPFDGKLYGVVAGPTDRIVVIDPATGAIGSSVNLTGSALRGTNFGVDFNPVADRLRIVSDENQNLRVDVATGSSVNGGQAEDGPLAYAAGDARAGTNPDVRGAAYTNPTASATSTALLDIDVADEDTLVRQDPANSGTLISVGATGTDVAATATATVQTTAEVGFDIAADGSGYAVLFDANISDDEVFYSVDIATGEVSPLGNFSTRSRVEDVALALPVTGVPSPGPSTTPPSPGPSSPPPAQCATPARVQLDRDTIIATGSAGVSVTGPAGSTVDLYAYTRPSSTFRVVRTGVVGTDGRLTLAALRPPANTRLYALTRGCTADIARDSVVLNVRTALSLFAKRNGVRDYTFNGDSLPARPGGLIVSLYRVTDNGRQVLTSQARASATTGEYTINRRFTGTGRFGFVVRTGQDLQNAPGSSNVRPTLIY